MIKELAHSDLNLEPLLDELLSDPIAHLLMQTDGVKQESLSPLFEDILSRLADKEVA